MTRSPSYFRIMKKAALLFLFILINTFLYAQGYVDQQAIYPLVESQKGSIDNVEKVNWQLRVYDGKWDKLLAYADSLPGEMKGTRRYVIELANRVTGDNMKKGRELFIPSSFPADYRAYSPYPFVYEIAANMPKLFIIDKFTQTFGAYEFGKLVHWGLISSGRKNDLTPVGRYNFNWKSPYRKSTAAPPGEVWEMYWLFNFHAKFGIHVHQYSLPIGAAVSHGCVRTSEPDAIWNYGWANGWVKDKKGKLIKNGTPVMVINSNPKGRPAQWDNENGEVVSQVVLPARFEDVRLGTIAQKMAAWDSGQ